MSIFNEFMAGRSELLEMLMQFEKKHKTGILHKLQKENNEDQFKSTIAELRFGFFFDSLSSSLEYDHPIEGKTPDWVVEMNRQTILIEVLRLGPSAVDRQKFAFENPFFECVQSIPIGCHLHLEYEDEDIENEIDYVICKAKIECWLNTRPKLNETLVLHGSVEITLQDYRPEFEHACLSGGGGTIHFDYRRISSNLEKKAMKYAELIESKYLPYIVCIYMDYHSWFREDDLFEILYGGSVQDITYDTRYCDLNKVRYNSSMRNVSGVLMMQGNNFYYYHNFSIENKLTCTNSNTLKEWQFFID